MVSIFDKKIMQLLRDLLLLNGHNLDGYYIVVLDYFSKYLELEGILSLISSASIIL